MLSFWKRRRPKLIGAEGAREKFDWPNAQKKIWQIFGGGGGGGAWGTPPPPSGDELLKGALGRDPRGGQRSCWTGSWRRLPKRLGGVTVGYKCHRVWHLPSRRPELRMGWASGKRGGGGVPPLFQCIPVRGGGARQARGSRPNMHRSTSDTTSTARKAVSGPAFDWSSGETGASLHAGHCWVAPELGGGGGRLFGALASPGRPTRPPPSESFLSEKMKFMKGSRNVRPSLGTQTFFWPLVVCPPRHGLLASHSRLCGQARPTKQRDHPHGVSVSSSTDR